MIEEISHTELLAGLDIEQGHKVIMYESTESTAALIDAETGEILFIDTLH